MMERKVKNECVRKVANSLEKGFSQEEFSLVHFTHYKLKGNQKKNDSNTLGCQKKPLKKLKKIWQHFM
jgi:hypothetical protein